MVSSCGCRQLAAAEGRVAHVNQRAAELSAEVASLQEQLAGALQQLGALEGEHAALKDEFRAMGEDMEALVRENQVRQGRGVDGCCCWSVQLHAPQQQAAPGAVLIACGREGQLIVSQLDESLHDNVDLIMFCVLSLSPMAGGQQ
jgi:septal ring factor EnvC (AmiA/AmiB activator)